MADAEPTEASHACETERDDSRVADEADPGAELARLLKTDGLFVEDLRRDAIDRAMVRCVARAGRILGERTVAEFVEGRDSLALLRALGVDYAQGDTIAAPLPLGSR